MKTRNLIGLYVLLSSVGFTQTVKIGCVDIRGVYYKYDKAIKLEETFNKEVTTVEELGNSIKKMQADYEQKKDIMKPEERIKKEAELKLKLQEYSSALGDFKKKMDEKQKETEKIREEIIKEVKAYGEKNNFTVIFSSAGIVYAGMDVIDITDEIVKIMNKKPGDKK